VKIEIDIVPEKLVTKRGEVKFDPASIICPVCGEKMRLLDMNNDGYEYDFKYECPKCESDILIETKQLHGFID
jgi:ssDNA-binding Zn-finger/Zn-ribbon topoisomerase 1